MNGDFDLDLTYIKENVIGMRSPSEGFKKWYRNNINEVAKMLDEKYGKDNYKVYNLCFERTYDANKFHGNVEQWPIMDHNVTVFQNNFKVLKQQVRFIMSHTLIKC